MKKIKNILFLIMLSLILCVPSFAVNASQVSAYYKGTWWDLYSKRCYMEIAPYNDMIFVTISWGSSAFQTSQWTMTGIYNPETNKFHYNDCTSKILFTDDYGNNTEMINYVNGTGTIYIADNGYLYWEDDVEQTGIDCYFEKEILPDWSGTYISDDDQTIIISAYNETGVLMTYVGYSEEGWHSWTQLLSYRDGIKTQVSYPYFNDIDGQLIHETVYTLSDNGIDVQVLPGGGWDVGFYTRQK